MAAEGKGFTPMCQRPCGCPIEEIATDLDVNRFLNTFMQARGLFEMNKISSLLEKTYQELGLLEDTDLLFELEKKFIEQQNKRAKEQQDDNKWKNIMR